MASGGSENQLLSSPGGYFPTPRINRPSAAVSVAESFDPRNIPRQFTRQYCQTYIRRLRALRPKLENLIRTEWRNTKLTPMFELFSVDGKSGNAPPTQHGKVVAPFTTITGAKTVNALQAQNVKVYSKKSVAIIGTILKYQPQKPSILQEITFVGDSLAELTLTKNNQYTSSMDYVQIEDDTNKMGIVFNAKTCSASVDNLVNGVVCAFKGKLLKNGMFLADDVIYPFASPARPIQEKILGDMVFVSGLNISSKSSSTMFKLDLLFDALAGLSGSPSEQTKVLAKRTQFFLLGNTFAKLDDGSKEEDKKKLFEGMKRIDEMLCDLAKTMDVFIVPGETDPCEPSLPQLPIHRSILPLSYRRKTFKALTNPTRLEIGLSNPRNGPKLDVMLTAGQNVTDALKNCVGPETPSEMALYLLRIGHQCPTAPDTLPLKPDQNEDVFVVDVSPHIYAIGNQPNFDVNDWQNTKIITVPEFSKTGIAVILNDEMEVLPFGISSNLF